MTVSTKALGIALAIALAIVGALCLWLYISKGWVEKDLADARTRIATLEGAVASCNAATDTMRKDTQRREGEQADLLAEARRQNGAQQSAIERLARGAVAVRPPAPGCTISNTVREVESQL